jgi:hypothetical protein
MMLSYSAKSLLDDLSKVSSFAKNKELAKVYATLVSSLLRKTAQAGGVAVPPSGVFDKLQSYFYAGADRASGEVKTIDPAISYNLSMIKKKIEQPSSKSLFDAFPGMSPKDAENIGYYAGLIFAAKPMGYSKIDNNKKTEFVKKIQSAFTFVKVYDYIRSAFETTIAEHYGLKRAQLLEPLGLSSYSSADSKALYGALRPKLVLFFQGEQRDLAPYQTYLANYGGTLDSEASSGAFAKLYQRMANFAKNRCGVSAISISRIRRFAVEAPNMKFNLPVDQNKNQDQKSPDGSQATDGTKFNLQEQNQTEEKVEPAEQENQPKSPPEEEVTEADCVAINKFLKTFFNVGSNLVLEVHVCEAMIDKAITLAKNAKKEQGQDEDGQSGGDYALATNYLYEYLISGDNKEKGSMFIKLSKSITMLRILSSNSGGMGY